MASGRAAAIASTSDFGSRARGEEGLRSDVDVAVLLERKVGLKEELRLRSRLVEELQRDDIDLVVLNFAPVRLKSHDNVRIRNVDLQVYLEELSYFLRAT